MRTYDRDTWHRANATWTDFGPEWAEVRQIAASRGMLYAPSGSPDDDRDSDEPSQRAIIWRALEDNPGELRAILRTSSSWSQVVDRIFGLETRLRLTAGEDERDAAFDRDQFPTHRESVMTLGQIIGRLEDSRA